MLIVAIEETTIDAVVKFEVEYFFRRRSRMNESAFRENIVELLKGGQAHLKIEKALKGVGESIRVARPKGSDHSIWDLVEHLRIAQDDILKYMFDSAYEEMNFPDDYWPPKDKAPTNEEWNHSVEGLIGGVKRLIELVEDRSFDLTAAIPHGEWRTYLREVLLAADHNAYHLGQIVQLRKLLEA